MKATGSGAPDDPEEPDAGGDAAGTDNGPVSPGFLVRTLALQSGQKRA